MFAYACACNYAVNLHVTFLGTFVSRFRYFSHTSMFCKWLHSKETPLTSMFYLYTYQTGQQASPEHFILIIFVKCKYKKILDEQLVGYHINVHLTAAWLGFSHINAHFTEMYVILDSRTVWMGQYVFKLPRPIVRSYQTFFKHSDVLDKVNPHCCIL